MSSNPNPVALKCPQCGGNIPPDLPGYTICQYCGSSLVWQRSPAGENMPAPAARGMRMKLIHCEDPEGTGMEVFRMLVPSGWESRGGCRWLLDNPGMPAVINFQVWNPRGGEAFEILPNINFIWNNSPMILGMFPPGSRYYGAEVGQPVTISEAFHRFVLPRYRANYADLKVHKDEPLPDLPRLVKSEAPLTGGGQAEGGKVRIAYTWNEWCFEEDIFAVVEVFRTQIPAAFGYSEVITWFIDYIFSCRALAGKLDSSTDLFRAMLGSFQTNPHWYAAFKSIAQFLVQQQIQRIHHIGQIGQIIAQTGREIREQNLQSWYSRQEVYERLAVEHSRQIRDVDGFFDPHRQEVVELPAGYGIAWANNLGEYILTDDPNFNPNIESTLHWESMQQQ